MGSVPYVLKKFILFLQLKQTCKLYNFGPSKLFQFHFGTEVYFYYFFPWLREKRERKGLLDSGGREKLVVGTDLGH